MGTTGGVQAGVEGVKGDTMRMRRPTRAAIAIVVAAAGALPACGSDEDGGAASTPVPASSNAPAPRGGAMLAVGLIGLAAAAVCGAADYRTLTNARRLIPA